jgi:hypothetical protein
MYGTRDTYTVLVAVQVASIQFPSPGSYQSVASVELSRRSTIRTSGSPHRWTVSLAGLTDITEWTKNQCETRMLYEQKTYVVVVGLTPAPPPRGVVVVVLAVVLLDDDEEEVVEVRTASGSSKGSTDAELDEEVRALVSRVPVGATVENSVDLLVSSWPTIEMQELTKSE